MIRSGLKVAQTLRPRTAAKPHAFESLTSIHPSVPCRSLYSSSHATRHTRNVAPTMCTSSMLRSTQSKQRRGLSWSSTNRTDANDAEKAVVYQSDPALPLKTYHAASDHSMDSLTEYLEDLIESSGNKEWDIEYSAGVLTLKIGDNSYVINKQPPNQQIWLSSPISGPKRYDYSPQHKVWFYHRDNTLMKDLLNDELRVLMKNEDVNVDLGEEQ